jgi:hypothetical protein
MKHSSSPAYTMGKKYPAEPETTNRFTPSPLAYNTRDSVTNVPSSIFGKALRSVSVNKSVLPGPGSYQISSFVDQVIAPRKGKRRQMMREKGEKIIVSSPGPGSYNPLKPLPKISYSMGNKTYSLPSDSSKQIETPLGPGCYSPEISPVMKSFTFSKSKRYASNLDYHPGPGDYETDSKSFSPSHQFTRQEKIRIDSTFVPSPNTYNLSSFADEARQKPGFKIQPKRDLPNNSLKTPGPGAFNPIRPGQSVPAFSIGKGKRPSFNRVEDGPGPGEYSLKNNSSPGKTIGKSNRSGLEGKNEAPGPGNYEISSFLMNGPKFSMVGRKEVTSPDILRPGPGQYEPDYNLPKAHSFHATIGKGNKRYDKQMMVTPGPGTYEVSENLTSSPKSPVWTFKKSSKYLEGQEEDPGPGHYEIPSTIPDLPKYVKLLKSKKT